MSEVPQNEPVQITLVDLQNAVRIIDAAAERGAFKGNELTSVGGTRDKLAAFIEASTQKEAPESVDADGQQD